MNVLVVVRGIKKRTIEMINVLEKLIWTFSMTEDMRTEELHFSLRIKNSRSHCILWKWTILVFFENIFPSTRHISWFGLKKKLGVSKEIKKGENQKKLRYVFAIFYLFPCPIFGELVLIYVYIHYISHFVFCLQSWTHHHSIIIS